MTRASTLLVLGLLGCAPPDDPRTAWLVEQLTRDNRIWWTRDPDQLAAKYRTMAADPYDWMRGTAGVFLRDQERPGTDRVPTAFLDDPHLADVLLAGDPHPENVGGHLPGWPPPETAETFRLDLNDFDGVGHGPWIWDLRRAAVGMSVLVAPDEDACPPDTCRDAMIAGLARGYAEAVLTPDDALAIDDLRGWGEAVSRLAVDLIDKGRTRDEVGDQTEADGDGGLRLVREPVDADGDGLVDLTDAERREVDQLLAAWAPHAPAGFRLLDVVRRLGRGVASQPATRYIWLWDTGDPSTDDERLVQVREVVDPPAVPGFALPVPGLFGSQADRVRGAAEALWAVSGSDPLLTGLEVGPRTFKVITWSGYTDGFDHEDLLEDLQRGRTEVADLVALARFVGTLLGGAHTRGTTASGRAVRPALRRALDGRVDGLVEETVSAARADLTRTLADHERFVRALDRLGPWLGADLLYLDEEPTP